MWVNSEAILEKCVVGYLVGVKQREWFSVSNRQGLMFSVSKSIAKKSTNLAVSIHKPPFLGESSASADNGEDVLSLQVPGKSNIGPSHILSPFDL